MIGPGDDAPALRLPDARTGTEVRDPWREGPVALVFFKVTCPTCRLAAPVVQALADAGAKVVAIGEDPPDALARYADEHGQHVLTLSEAPPYPVSEAYRLETVPTLVVVGSDGRVIDATQGWDRDAWNRVALAAGVGPVSTPADGLPPFKPG